MVTLALVVGLVVFVMLGANRPADPRLAPPGVQQPPAFTPGLSIGDPAAARRARPPFGAFREVAVQVADPDGRLRGWCLLLAATEEQRARGLMEVTDLGPYRGMVFVFDDESASSFWMRNTPMPLSLAFLDAAGRVISTERMAPCGDREDCPTYAPEGPYRFAIEVPQGRLDDLGIERGSRVAVGGSCPA